MYKKQCYRETPFIYKPGYTRTKSNIEFFNIYFFFEKKNLFVCLFAFSLIDYFDFG